MGSRGGKQRKRQRRRSRSIEGSASPGDVVYQASSTASAAKAEAALRSSSSECTSISTSSSTSSSQSHLPSLDSNLPTDASERVRSNGPAEKNLSPGHFNLNSVRRSNLQRGAKDKVYAERLALRESHEGDKDCERGGDEGIVCSFDGEGVSGTSSNGDFRNDGSNSSTPGRKLSSGMETHENEENVPSSLNTAHRRKRRKIAKEKCDFASHDNVGKSTIPRDIASHDATSEATQHYRRSNASSTSNKSGNSSNNSSKTKQKKQAITNQKGRKKGNRISCPNWPFSMDPAPSVGVSNAASKSGFGGASEAMSVRMKTQTTEDMMTSDLGKKFSEIENHSPSNNMHGSKEKNSLWDTTLSISGKMPTKVDSGAKVLSSTNSRPVPKFSPFAPSSAEESLQMRDNADALPKSSLDTQNGTRRDGGDKVDNRSEISNMDSLDFGRKGATFGKDDSGTDSNSSITRKEDTYLVCNSSGEADSAVEEPPITGPNLPSTSLGDLTSTDAHDFGTAHSCRSPDLPSSTEKQQNHQSSTSKNPSPVNPLSPPKPLKSTKTTSSVTDKSIPSTTPSTTWTCKRCTLVNQSKRRKKCEACGTPRNLALSPDGSLALADSEDCGDSMGNSAVKENSAVDIEYQRNICTGDADENKKIRVDEPDQAFNDLGNNHASSSNGFSCFQSANSNSSSESSSSHGTHQNIAAKPDAIDLFSAMIDAPVSTRSRTRSKLNPAPPPQHERSSTPMENDSQQTPSQRKLNEGNDQSSSQPSELKQWLQKRHKVKKEIRRRKRISKASDIVEVKVRPLVAGEFVIPECLEHRERFDASNKNPVGSLEQPTAVLPRKVFIELQECQGLDPKFSRQSVRVGKDDGIALDQNESCQSSDEHNETDRNGESTAILEPTAANVDFAVSSGSTSCSDRASPLNSSSSEDRASQVEDSNSIPSIRHRQTSPAGTPSQSGNLDGTKRSCPRFSENSSASSFDSQRNYPPNSACSFEAEPVHSPAGLVKVTRIWVAGKSVGKNDLVANLVLPKAETGSTPNHKNHTVNISLCNGVKSSNEITTIDTLSVEVAGEHSIELEKKETLYSRPQQRYRKCDKEKQHFVSQLNHDIDDRPDSEDNPGQANTIMHRELGDCSVTFAGENNTNKVDETEVSNISSIPEQARTRFFVDEATVAEESYHPAGNPGSISFDSSIIPMTQSLPNFDYFSQVSLDFSPRKFTDPDWN